MESRHSFSKCAIYATRITDGNLAYSSSDITHCDDIDLGLSLGIIVRAERLHVVMHVMFWPCALLTAARYASMRYLFTVDNTIRTPVAE